MSKQWAAGTIDSGSTHPYNPFLRAARMRLEPLVRFDIWLWNVWRLRAKRQGNIPTRVRE